MKKFLLSFCLFFFYQGFAQMVVEDDYDSVKNRRKITIMAQPNWATNAANRINDTSTIGNVYLMTKVRKDSLERSKVELHLLVLSNFDPKLIPEKLIILTESGQSITLPSLGFNYLYGRRYYIYNIHSKQLDLLKKELLKGMKIYNNNGEIEFSLREKNVKRLQETFELTSSIVQSIDSIP